MRSILIKSVVFLCFFLSYTSIYSQETKNKSTAQIEALTEFILDRANDNLMYILKSEMEANTYLKIYMPELYKYATSTKINILIREKEILNETFKDDLNNLGKNLLREKLSSILDEGLNFFLDRVYINYKGKKIIIYKDKIIIDKFVNDEMTFEEIESKENELFPIKEDIKYLKNYLVETILPLKNKTKNFILEKYDLIKNNSINEGLKNLSNDLNNDTMIGKIIIFLTNPSANENLKEELIKSLEKDENKNSIVKFIVEGRCDNLIKKINSFNTENDILKNHLKDLKKICEERTLDLKKVLITKRFLLLLDQIVNIIKKPDENKEYVEKILYCLKLLRDEDEKFKNVSEYLDKNETDKLLEFFDISILSQFNKILSFYKKDIKFSAGNLSVDIEKIKEFSYFINILNDLENFRKQIQIIIKEKSNIAKIYKIDNLIRSSIVKNESVIFPQINIEDYNKFSNYLFCFATLANTDDKDEIISILKQLTLKPVSFGVKREEDSQHVMITAYFGGQAGVERAQEGDHGVYGLLVPIGFEYSHSTRWFPWFGSWSFMISPIELSHPVNQNINNSHGEMEYGDIFTPGAYLTLGAEKYPLSIGIGCNWGQSFETKDENDFRYFFFIAMDMPLFNF